MSQQPSLPDVGNGTATLVWTAPSKNNDGTPLKNLTGYVVNYGRSPGALTHRIIVSDPSAQGIRREESRTRRMVFQCRNTDGRRQGSTDTHRKKNH